MRRKLRRGPWCWVGVGALLGGAGESECWVTNAAWQSRGRPGLAHWGYIGGFKQIF